jgi:hypothetical protein
MARAAANTITRTSAQDLFDTDGILMTSVDTGWITDGRPLPTKVRLAERGIHAELHHVRGVLEGLQAVGLVTTNVRLATARSRLT